MERNIENCCVTVSRDECHNLLNFRPQSVLDTYIALFVCLTLLASFFYLSFKNTYIVVLITVT